MVTLGTNWDKKDKQSAPLLDSLEWQQVPTSILLYLPALRKIQQSFVGKYFPREHYWTSEEQEIVGCDDDSLLSLRTAHDPKDML